MPVPLKYSQLPAPALRFYPDLAPANARRYHPEPMRWTLAGLFLLTISTLTATAVAQTAGGEVQAIGYNGSFRPDAWVPMVVRIKPAKAEADNYQVRVYQHDQDGDRAVYVRNITVGGSGTAGDQLFWMYFLPEPIHHGLPDQTGGTLKDLQRALTVYLCDSSGKQLSQLPVTSTLSNVDPIREGGGSAFAAGHQYANKLVLAVSANGSQQMPLGDFANVVGVTQGMEVVALRERDLPENPLGYEPVDAVVWLDGDPADLDAGGSHGFSALRDFVRFGGQLVITQPTSNWQQTGSFGDLLPVDVTGVVTKQKDFEPLRSMAAAPNTNDGLGDATDRWDRVRPPFQYARATAKPGTVVDRWVTFEDGSPQSPYLARRAAGLGSVTWVAQPLTVEAQPTNVAGWPYVWLSVFGWRSDAYVPPPQLAGSNLRDDPPVKARLERYAPGDPVDLGHPFMQGLNLGSRGAWLIVLAIGFFVVYWLVAGPGTYGYLVAKKRQGLSWFFFAVAALVATAVTIGVVKLVLRGPPQVRHLTMIRIAPGQPAIAMSRIGLYIPRDGDQTVELADTTPGQLSYLSALAEHPQELGDISEFPAPLDYDVPIRDLGTTDEPSLTVPYRSSLKKFQARWVGELPPKINASLTLDPDDARLPLKGTLTNDTGMDLADVYLAFHLSGDRDWMLYLPTWTKGTAIDLKRDLAKLTWKAGRGNPALAEPGQNKVISDELTPTISRVNRGSGVFGWENYFYTQLPGAGGATGGGMARIGDNSAVAFPMASLLGRLPPMPNLQGNGGTFDNSRSELYARGVRLLDAGPSVSAGQLLVVAATHGPLPIPVRVDGNLVTGDGTTLYQFLLPIDRGTTDRPTTKPSAE